MMLNPNEAGKFWNFRGLVENHRRSKFRLIFADKTEVQCTYFTSCESDNNLELDDPNYEEFWIIVFRKINSDETFEINFHNMPVEVWCDGRKIDLKKEAD